LFTFTEDGLTLIPGVWALLPAIPVSLWIWRRGSDRRRTLMALLAVIHVDLVIALTIFPIPIGGQEFYRVSRGLTFGDNFVPFSTILSQITDLNPQVDHNARSLVLGSLRQLGGNLLALAPLGIYGPALWPRLRNWRRFALVAVAFGVGIETAQFLGSLIEGFAYRITDVDDAILNATGAIAAFFVWRGLERRGVVDRWLERMSGPEPERAAERPID
jgi:glycopeptide antibiotics resistance protein